MRTLLEGSQSPVQLSISSGEELMKFLSVGERVGAVLVMERCQVESSKVGGCGGVWEEGQSTGRKTIECWLLLLVLSGMEIIIFSSPVREKRVGFMCSPTIAGDCDSVRHPGWSWQLKTRRLAENDPRDFDRYRQTIVRHTRITKPLKGREKCICLIV